MQTLYMKIVIFLLVISAISAELFHDVPKSTMHFTTPRSFGTPPFNPKISLPGYRFRRSPQGSVGVSTIFTEHQKPQLSVDYQHQIISNDKRNLNAYGGVNSPDLRHFTPHAGVNYEWKPSKDTFLRANTGIQQGSRGHVTPTFGATFGTRFRRSPQGSVGVSTIFTEHQKPQLSVDYQHQIISNDKRNLNAYGGVNSPDLRHFTPHAGVNYEWKPSKDTFVRGNTGFQQGSRGRVTPTFGATFGTRFRRDTQELETD